MPTTRTPKKIPLAERTRKPVRTEDLTKYAVEGSAIYVQNTLPTISMLVIRVDGAEEESEFGPAGSPNGSDVMELPSVYLKNAQFRKQLKLGIFKIVDADDPNVVSAFENQQKAWEAQQQAKAESDKYIDAQQPRAFSGVQCLAQEGRNQCSEFAIYAQNTRERPPLCQKHSHLSGQFTPEETGTFTDGKPDIRWNRVSILGR